MGYQFFNFFGPGAFESFVEGTETQNELNVTRVGAFDSGLGEGAAEIVAHDPATQRLYVINAEAGTVDIIDIASPNSPTKVGSIDVNVVDGITTGGPNSVAVANGIIAVAVQAETVTDPGVIAFFDTDGNLLGTVEVGALPDMVTFTPDGNTVLVANEGSPDEGIDPVGSVSVIDISGGIASATVATADFTAFDDQQEALEAAGLRIFPGETLSSDVEPEYIAVSPDGTQAFITLQEANAVAVLDIATATITEIQPLGVKDHSLTGNGLDASDKDDAINIATVPVFGLYMPDAIASYEADGQTYYVTANEGDSRDFDEDRIKDLDLDPTAFPDAETLQADENIGRLQVSNIDGDTDGDGDFDELYAYGSRSFTIRDANGNVVFDSGDMLEQITAEFTPDLFNANDGDPGEFDTRSDNKGPEPESVVVGEVNGQTYAFVALERAAGGVVVFNISNPTDVTFVQYIVTADDIAPEGLAFITANDSPTGSAMIAVSNEVSGTVSLYEIDVEGQSLAGTRRADEITGADGDDTIDAGNGRDTVDAGAGDDVIDAGSGADEVSGGAGNDDISGGRGRDLLNGDQGDDTIDGGVGRDTIDGGSGNDLIMGDRGADEISGGDGDDTIDGGIGRDTIDGGDGDDLIKGDRGRDVLSGGDGDDTIEAGWGRDTIDGGDGDDHIYVGRGRDVVEGGAGTDTLHFEGDFADYKVDIENGTVRGNGEGRNEFTGIEFLQFADQKVALPAFTLELLHIADQEAAVGAITDAPNLSAVLNALRMQDLGNDGVADNTLTLSSGDAFIPGLFFDASEAAFGSGGIADIEIQNQLGFQAIALGNHEFDFGTGTLAGLIDGSAPGDILGGDFGGANFPYLSTNLDFSTDENLAPLEVAGGGAPQAATVTSSVVTETNGELIGVVGATTPTVDVISSPGTVGILPEEFDGNPTPEQLDALAAEIQLEVDALLAANPSMNKVILLAHMQQIGIEQELAARLENVDIIVAGGSNTRLLDENDRLRDGDSQQGEYPIFIENAGGTVTAVVNTDGSYKYVGRLVVDFDAEGNIIADSYDVNVSGAYATDAQGVADLDAAGLVDPEIQEIVDAIEAEIIATESNVFGVSNVFLNGNRSGIDTPTDTDGVRTQETNLGNLTADANLAIAQSFDASVEVSIKNGGGIRANIGQTIVPAGGTEAVRTPNEAVVDSDGNVVKPEGGISQNDIATTLAFNNGLTLLTLTKAELVAVLEHGIGGVPSAQGRFPQVSGVEFSYDDDLPEGSRIINATIVDENGNPVEGGELVVDGSLADDAGSLVRIVTLNFMAGGGDGYPFPQGPEAERVDLYDIDADGIDDDALTGAATFAADGTEQDALAEYLAANFPDAENAFDQADTGRDLDERIQNLDFQEDTVFDITPVVDEGDAIV